MTSLITTLSYVSLPLGSKCDLTFKVQVESHFLQCLLLQQLIPQGIFPSFNPQGDLHHIFFIAL